jgi:hypothetical protein
MIMSRIFSNAEPGPQPTWTAMLWGIYTAYTRGLYSALLQVQKSHEALFRQILGHFDSLWKFGGLNTDPDETYLVKFDS